MWKKTVAIALAIFFWEAAILYISGVMTTWEPTVTYQLAARYSARTSFAVLVITLLWVGIKGLKGIFATGKTKEWFVVAVAIFGVNHLIHFGFLVVNYYINDLSLLQVKFLFGGITYLFIIFVPVHLNIQDRKLTRRLYRFLHLYLMVLTSLFIMTYLGRLSKILPMSSPPFLFKGLLTLSAFLIILNLYRIHKEWKQIQG